jgi:hypothetical protein
MNVITLSCHFSMIASIPYWGSDLVFFDKFREESWADEFGGLLYEGFRYVGIRKIMTFLGLPQTCSFCRRFHPAIVVFYRDLRQLRWVSPWQSAQSVIRFSLCRPA